MTRRKGRFGRYLPTMPAELFLDSMPAFSSALVRGMTVAKMTRPYLTQDGALHVRLAFRSRADGNFAVVISFTLAGRISRELQDALAHAVGPQLRLHIHSLAPSMVAA